MQSYKNLFNYARYEKIVTTEIIVAIIAIVAITTSY